MIRTLMVDWLKEKNFAAAEQHIENMESTGMDVSELRAMLATAQTVLPSVKDPAFETALMEYGAKANLTEAQRLILNDIRVDNWDNLGPDDTYVLTNDMLTKGHWELAQLVEAASWENQSPGTLPPVIRCSGRLSTSKPEETGGPAATWRPWTSSRLATTAQPPT